MAELKKAEAPVTKPGIKTTEFWMTLAANIVGILILTGIFTPAAAAAYLILAEKVCGLLIMAVPLGLYIYSRIKAKIFTIGDIPWNQVAGMVDNIKIVAEQVDSMTKDKEIIIQKDSHAIKQRIEDLEKEIQAKEKKIDNVLIKARKA